MQLLDADEGQACSTLKPLELLSIAALLEQAKSSNILLEQAKSSNIHSLLSGEPPTCRTTTSLTAS